MINKFMSHCYYNDEIIFIKFNTQMCTVGVNSILDPSNYSIITNYTSVLLSDYIKSNFYTSDYFVSFNVTNSFKDAVFNSSQLSSASIRKNHIGYVTDINGFINNFECGSSISKITEKSSLQNCTFEILENRKIVITDNNLVNFIKLYLSDFYITINDVIVKPLFLEKFEPNIFILHFKDEILKTSDDILTLNIIELAASTDALNRTILNNDSVLLKNDLLPTVKAVSIYSYENTTLTLAFECNNRIMRYDANDFYIYINNKEVIPTSKSRYLNKNIFFIDIENIYAFDPNNTFIRVSRKEKKLLYTIDSNFNILKPFNIINKNAFIGLCASITIASDNAHSVLSLKFNYNLPIIQNLSSTAKFTLNTDKTVAKLTFDNIGELSFYGSSLANMNSLDFTVNTSNSVLEFITSSELLSFSNQNDVKYIDFAPSFDLRAIDNTLIFRSFEIPVTFSTLTTIICNTEDFGDDWSLLGSDIYLPVIIYVNKSVYERNYGSLNLKTTFHNNVYIRHQVSEDQLGQVYLKFINIKAEKMHVYLSDEYKCTFNSSSLTNVKILDE